jgi:hypothetical protein
MKSSCCASVLCLVLCHSGIALAVDCFVDSRNGDDSLDGSTEATAVKTQTKIPKACSTVKYKRGSLFNEKVAIAGSAKVFTNYGDPADPLPKFIMPGTANTGAVVSSYQGGITVDGLYLANSHGDGSSASFSTGVCVTLGGNSVFQNNEITSCDIGVMLSGTGSKFLNNYVHDLNTMVVDASQSSGAYINSVGGAEAIFVNGSNNEVAYNTFVNCTGTAQWTGGGCDGGATEASVPSGGTLSGVKIHHNYAYNTCGFFEVSGKGTFADSDFYNNVVVDSGWLMLLQVNETTLSNIRWINNTVVQHKGSTNAGMVTTIYGGSGTAGGPVSGVTLPPGQVSMTNNLIILDGISAFGSTIDANISQTTNLVATTDPGVKNLKGTAAADFDLVTGSSAIDKGTVVPGMTIDYLNRTVPSNGIPDIGAFEFGATASASAGGAPSAVTTTATATSPTSTGGAGSTNVAKGGAAPNPAIGGRSSVATTPTLGGRNTEVTSAPQQTGGTNSATSGITTRTDVASGIGGTSILDTSAGGRFQSSTGGSPSSDTPARPSATDEFSSGGTQTNSSAASSRNATPASADVAVVQPEACSCRIPGRTRTSYGLGLLLGLIWLRARGGRVIRSRTK